MISFVKPVRYWDESLGLYLDLESRCDVSGKLEVEERRTL